MNMTNGTGRPSRIQINVINNEDGRVSHKIGEINKDIKRFMSVYRRIFYGSLPAYCKCDSVDKFQV